MSTAKKQNISDKDIQVVLGTLLRAGVIISMSIVLIGGVVFLIHNNGVITDYKVFKPELSKFSSIAAIFKGLSTLPSDFNSLCTFCIKRWKCTRIFLSSGNASKKVSTR